MGFSERLRSAISAQTQLALNTAITVGGNALAAIGGNALDRRLNDLPAFDRVQTPAFAAQGIAFGSVAALVELGFATSGSTASAGTVALLSNLAAAEATLPGSLLLPAIDFARTDRFNPILDVYCTPKCF